MNNKHPLGWERITSHEPVYIPAVNGIDILETFWVDVPAWKDPATNEIYLDDVARDKIESVKARYLGILNHKQILELRNAIGLTQKEMSELLQLGEKSWTRWESGKEHPSRSMNILLSALYDGHLSVSYLRTLADPELRMKIDRWRPTVSYGIQYYEDESKPQWCRNECSTIAA